MKIALALMLCSTAHLARVARAAEPESIKGPGFESVLHAARLSVSSGKIVLLQRAGDPHHVIGANVGEARVMPVFDVRLHSAAILMRVTF